MNLTYLPLANVSDSVALLHREDLLLTTVDALKTLACLADLRVPEKKRSLCERMWLGYEGGLWFYFLTCCKEMQRRTESAVVTLVKHGMAVAEPAGFAAAPPLLPRWFGWRPIHRSHASTLIRQRPTHYGQRWPDVPLDMPVLWPRNRQHAFDFSVTIDEEQRRALKCGELILNVTTQIAERTQLA